MGGSASSQAGVGKFFIPPAEQVLRIIGGPASDGAGSCAELPGRVSVLIWNCQKAQDSGFASAFPRLMQNRDLALLQEVQLHDASDETFLLSSSPRICGYSMATSFCYQATMSPTGVAIGSAVPHVEGSAEFQITPDREPIVGTPKASLIARFGLQGGRQLLAATVHGLNRTSQEAFEKQMGCLVESLKGHTGPMILAGDFNTQSAKKTKCLEACAATLGLTAVRFDPDARTLSKLSRRPLDHVFVRGGRVESSACWDQVGGSDHVAMTVDVVF